MKHTIKYEREEMRKALASYGCEDGKVVCDGVLTAIEQTFGIHTPAPVGGEKHTDGICQACRPKPQENRCTCASDVTGEHASYCPIYQLPVPKVELPEDCQFLVLQNLDSTQHNLDSLKDTLNAALAYLRAQQDK